MSVYVDKLVPYPHARHRCFRLGACHMVADTQTELHEFARRIGLKRVWFQSPPKASFPHYDLTESHRIEAVKFGAIEVGRNDFVTKMRELRAAGWP